MFPDMAFLQNESHYWVQLATPRFLRHKGAASNTAFFEAHFFVRGIPLPCKIFWSVLIPLGLAHDCVEGHSLTCATWTNNVGTPDIYLYFLFLQNRQKIGICISEIQIDQNVKIHTKSQTTLIIKTFQINYLNNQKKKLFFSKKYIYGGQKRARALPSSEPLGSGAEGALLYMQ